MRETIWRQPADLRGLAGDPESVRAQAERLAGRRIVAVGTGTSWHAANHAVWLRLTPAQSILLAAGKPVFDIELVRAWGGVVPICTPDSVLTVLPEITTTE